MPDFLHLPPVDSVMLVEVAVLRGNHCVHEVRQESSETGTIRRGASTITQQLVKNLFFTTPRNPVRKAFEYTLYLPSVTCGPPPR
jgi:hypothetical protein